MSRARLPCLAPTRRPNLRTGAYRQDPACSDRLLMYRHHLNFGMRPDKGRSLEAAAWPQWTVSNPCCALARIGFDVNQSSLSRPAIPGELGVLVFNWISTSNSTRSRRPGRISIV
jgi:hypothetical protein